MHRLDEAILDRVERFSHWSQRNINKTNFFWAKVADVVMMMSVVPMYRTMTVGLSSVTYLIAALVILYTLAAWLRDLHVEQYYASCQRAAHGYSFQMRKRWYMRIVALAAMVLCAINGFAAATPWIRELAPWGSRFCFQAAAMWASLAAGYYFRSVVPLPPGAVRQHKGVTRLIPVPVTNPSRK